MKNIWAPYLRHTAMAGLLCSIVILLNILVGLVCLKLFYSFWFFVALWGFTPVWLVCYGLLFFSRWRWHELVSGVFLSLSVIGLFYLRDTDDWSYKGGLTLIAALFGCFAMSLGFWTAWLLRSIRHDFRGGFLHRQIKRWLFFDKNRSLRG